MTCCFIAHSAQDGGAERVLLETIQLLHAGGVECRVVAPGDGPFCQQLRAIGIVPSILSFPHWMTRDRVGLLGWLRLGAGAMWNTIFLARMIGRWEADLVYSNTVTFCVGALAAGILRKPHVWHLHEFGYEDQGLSFLFGNRFSLAVVNRLSTSCICVSQALERRYSQSVDPSKINVIYPSMHLVSGEAKPVSLSAGFRCVLVGALIEGKRQEDAIRAIGILAGEGLDVDLVLVGGGVPTYRDRLATLVKILNLGDRVIFQGKVASPVSLVQSSDAVLMCSVSEAFGRTTIEGMLAGKPVIGARAGATPELIEDGVTGLLYVPGDAADLAGRIRSLYEDRSLAARLGQNAQAWAVRQFRAERYRSEMLAVLHAAMAR